MASQQPINKSTLIINSHWPLVLCTLHFWTETAGSQCHIYKYRVILSVLEPRKCEYLKDYSLDFEHAYMTTYLASWEACRYLFAALWHPDVIGTTTGVWRHVAHSRVIVFCGSEGEWCTQRMCGSTWWWRAVKRLFSAGWSHMPRLEWQHDRNRKLFWWPDYFESLMAAKISWTACSSYMTDYIHL